MIIGKTMLFKVRIQLWKGLNCPEWERNVTVSLARFLTKAANFRATPEPIGHALPHSGAHQRIPRVAGEDGRCPVDRQSSDAMCAGWDRELTTGDD